MYKIFLDTIKTGNLTQAESLYQQYKKDIIGDIEDILLPKLKNDATMEEIKDSPYGYAVHHNYVDICDWLFKNFPNVEYNINNVVSYDMLDEVCELGHLEMLKWMHHNYKFLFGADYHIDSYLIALTDHHFEVADYLLEMFGADKIFKDTTNILIEKMLKNPDKDVLFYFFTKLKQRNKTVADLLIILSGNVSMNDSQYRQLRRNFR